MGRTGRIQSRRTGTNGNVGTMGIRQWIEHKTNPLHILSKIVGAWLLYDKVWSWLFDRDSYKDKIELMHEIYKMKKKRGGTLR